MNQLIQLERLTNEKNIELIVFLTDKCNYNCYYCYNNKPRKNIDLNLYLLYVFVLKLYLYYKLPIFILLIGGETLLHPQLKSFVSLINKNMLLNVTLYVYSNFSLNLDYYIYLLNHNVLLELTWHSLLFDKINYLFIDKLKQIPSKYLHLIRVRVMYEKDNINESIYIFNEILKLKIACLLGILDFNKNNNIISLNNTNIIKKYSNDELITYTLLCNDNVYEPLLYKATYSDNTIDHIGVFRATLEDLFHHFKYWKCDAGLYHYFISFTGHIYKCVHYYDDNYNNFIGHITMNVQHILNKYTICPFNYCGCMWEIKKTRIINIYEK